MRMAHSALNEATAPWAALTADKLGWHDNPGVGGAAVSLKRSPAAASHRAATA